MKKDQKKTPTYPWDTICGILAVGIAFPLCMMVFRVDSVLLIGGITLVLFLIFEVLAHTFFKDKIAEKKAKIDAEFEAKEKKRVEKLLALNPAEQAFYDKFTKILATLSEQQYGMITSGFVRVKNITGFQKILYAENKALYDYENAKQFSAKGNEQNFEALKEYYEDLMRATGSYAYLKKNMTVKGPEFGVITTNAADTLLYGAIVESDIKKQARRNDQAQKAFFEQQTVTARTKLFSKVKI